MFLKLGRVMHSCDGAGGSIVYGRPELHSETPLKKKKAQGRAWWSMTLWQRRADICEFQEHPGLHSETLSKKKKGRKEGERKEGREGRLWKPPQHNYNLNIK